MTKALIPGSFDPVTLGHVRLIKKAAELFDSVEAVVFINTEKEYMFSFEQRRIMLCAACEGIKNVTVGSNEGYVADYFRECGADIIIKGVRNTEDYEYEVMISRVNTSLNSYAETLFYPADKDTENISSTAVREAIISGNDISGLVVPSVAKLIKDFKNK